MLLVAGGNSEGGRMFATTILSPARQRVVEAVSAVVRQFLMLVGLCFIVGLAGAVVQFGGWQEAVRALSGNAVQELPEDDPEALAEPVSQQGPALSKPMQRVLEHVSRRYHVSADALLPIFVTTQQSGRELGLDPLLIVAVIGIESRFNPFSQSVIREQGLMHVLPRFHQDKLPEDASDLELPFMDPVTNVQVGARVLKESIRRFGSMEDGLQQFGGALADPDRRYAAKVMAEKARLEQAAQRQRQA